MTPWHIMSACRSCSADFCYSYAGREPTQQEWLTCAARSCPSASMGRKDLGNLREVVASSMTIPFSTTFSMLYTSSVSGLQPCTWHAAALQLYTSSVRALQPCTRHAAMPHSCQRDTSCHHHDIRAHQ